MPPPDDRPLTHPILVGGEFPWRALLSSLPVPLAACVLGVIHLGSDGIILVLVGACGACLSLLVAAVPLCRRKSLVVTAGGFILKTLFTEQYFPDDAVRAVRRESSRRSGSTETLYRTDLVVRVGGREEVVRCEYHGTADNGDPLCPLLDRLATAIADGRDIEGDGWYLRRGVLHVGRLAVSLGEISAVIVRGNTTFYHRGDDLSPFLRVGRDEQNAEPLRQAALAVRRDDPTFNAPLPPPSPGRVLLRCRNAWPGGGRRYLLFVVASLLVFAVSVPMTVLHPAPVAAWGLFSLGCWIYAKLPRHLDLTENHLRYVGPFESLAMNRDDITSLTAEGYALLRVESSGRAGPMSLCVGTIWPRNGDGLIRIAAELAAGIARRWLAELHVREVPWTDGLTFTADGLRVGPAVVPYSCLVVTLGRHSATLSRVEATADGEVRTIIATIPLASPNGLPGLELLGMLNLPEVPPSVGGMEATPEQETTFASNRRRSLLPRRDK